MFVGKGGVGVLHWQREAKKSRLNSGGMRAERARRTRGNSVGGPQEKKRRRKESCLDH